MTKLNQTSWTSYDVPKSKMPSTGGFLFAENVLSDPKTARIHLFHWCQEVEVALRLCNVSKSNERLTLSCVFAPRIGSSKLLLIDAEVLYCTKMPNQATKQKLRPASWSC